MFKHPLGVESHNVMVYHMRPYHHGRNYGTTTTRQRPHDAVHRKARFVTVGHAVRAIALNGLGFVHQQLYRVPMFFQKSF